MNRHRPLVGWDNLQLVLHLWTVQNPLGQAIQLNPGKKVCPKPCKITVTIPLVHVGNGLCYISWALPIFLCSLFQEYAYAYLCLASHKLICWWQVWINVFFWETGHLPLPQPNIKPLFSLSAKCRPRGGVGGQFPRNIHWSTSFNAIVLRCHLILSLRSKHETVCKVNISCYSDFLFFYRNMEGRWKFSKEQ